MCKLFHPVAKLLTNSAVGNSLNRSAKAVDFFRIVLYPVSLFPVLGEAQFLRRSS